MNIRSANQEDIEGILQCLKNSLGETSSPKTRQYWLWKHIHNPFGKSPVLVAEDSGKIVGVRAFMRWRWRWKGNEYRALRAVDTATDPDYQGKGIFKKLTMSLLDICSEAGDDFIFNTPNSQSKPGYLKMGWSEVGKLPVRLRIRRPLSMIWKYLRKETVAVNVDTALPIFDLKKALAHYDDSIARYPRPSGMYTKKKSDFLEWRYVNCPIVHYYGYIEEDEDRQLLFIFYLKQQRYGNELRLCEVRVNNPLAFVNIRRGMKIIERYFKPDYWSVADLGDSVITDGLKRGGFGKPRKIGPLLTLRTLKEGLPADWSDMEPWDATLGDLELF